MLQGRRTRGAAALAVALLCAWSPALYAAGVAWSALTPEQRSALAPLQKEWADIDAQRQQKWLEIAARFPRISDDERRRMQERMTEWARLSPRERGQARITFQELRQLSPEERQARWESYRALPEEQRRELAARAQPVTAVGPKPAGAALRPDGDKSSIVKTPTAPATVRPVAPTVVQAAPGATTTLVTRTAQPPLHQQAGVPKIAATPAFVDTATLLPKSGAQGAAVVRTTPPAPRPAARPASPVAASPAPLASASEAESPAAVAPPAPAAPAASEP